MLAVGELAADGELARRRDARRAAPRRSSAARSSSCYGELDIGRLAGVAATGVYGDRLGEPALGGLPEEIAQEARRRLALPGRAAQRGARRRRRLLGAHARRARARGATRPTSAARPAPARRSRACARGSAARSTRPSQLAEASPDGVTVTSRCAVFAKSELTHFANQGEPHGRIFRGLFAGVARNVHSLYDKSKVDGPVVLDRPRGPHRPDRRRHRRA